VTVRHKSVYSKNQPFRTPKNRDITVLERCSRVHGTELGSYECPAVQVTTYAERHERHLRRMEAADSARVAEIKERSAKLNTGNEGSNMYVASGSACTAKTQLRRKPQWFRRDKTH